MARSTVESSPSPLGRRPLYEPSSTIKNDDSDEDRFLDCEDGETNKSTIDEETRMADGMQVTRLLFPSVFKQTSLKTPGHADDISGNAGPSSREQDTIAPNTANSTETEQEYEIADIVDWRYTETQSQAGPPRTCKGSALYTDSPITIPTIELLVHWKGFPAAVDYTYEDEGSLQLTAAQAVWEFWERESAKGPPKQAASEQYQCPRDVVLKIKTDDMGIPLRITRHRERGGAGADQARPTKRAKVTTKGRSQAAQPLSRGQRQGQESTEYLVEWVGYRTKTWEPASNLDQALIKAYWQSL
ncbi:hypothetical protein N0V93_010347 [Gnomoniopsis smithogilvyi]|uniref:Chromo domain-containing protein n=1 Tax=Gnomoniopsis smithogilvyi TaxID=1191159 RepID=A0A9W8YL42_9PEZI|nr:hypothetical protein N0V93_010347 [Gnomoniopsis smithogilvyi]